jgi:hypothetical protein
MLTGFMKRGAEKEVLAIGSMAQEKYFREAVLFNAPRLRRAKRVRQHAVVGASPLIFVYFTHLTTVT